ncbi:hypothetical protein RRG08_012540 [Elysia crispata]|uniref:Uncharacterized protein n=1 Tax=Elysia crispata TaxID=231223 RepID=A0AAE1AP89_9GAST|nr:hypothetical protein RRG08_012540 [Elysia crispata]
MIKQKFYLNKELPTVLTPSLLYFSFFYHHPNCVSRPPFLVVDPKLSQRIDCIGFQIKEKITFSMNCRHISQRLKQ